MKICVRINDVLERNLYIFVTLRISVRGYVRTLHSVPYILTVKEAVEWNYIYMKLLGVDGGWREGGGPRQLVVR